MTLRDVELVTNGLVSNAYLSQLENGRIKNPSARIVLALAAAYNVEPAEMLQWTGEKTEVVPPPLCPTCGSTWMDRLGVVIDASESAGPKDIAQSTVPSPSIDGTDQ